MVPGYPARRRIGRDRGAAAVELVLVTPLMVVLLLFVVAAGRMVQASLEVGSAAQQAARAASLARDPSAAVGDAEAVARSALGGQSMTCKPMSVSPDTGDFVPGGEISVRVSCTVDLSDLALLDIPGAQTVTATADSPIDVYRGDVGTADEGSAG